MLDVQVQYGLPRAGWPAARTLNRAAGAAWRGRGSAEVVIRVVDATEGLRLNREFRGRERPTNVLSFPAPPEAKRPGVPLFLGDIVLCAPVLAEEAGLQGKDLRAHFVHLVVHGMLHLQEFDHQTPEDAAVMETIERQILSGLGYPDPYAEVF
jgi:probable rRNA maturation factor